HRGLRKVDVPHALAGFRDGLALGQVDDLDLSGHAAPLSWWQSPHDPVTDELDRGRRQRSLRRRIRADSLAANLSVSVRGDRTVAYQSRQVAPAPPTRG